MKKINSSHIHPRLCFIGPMVGNIFGHVTTQGFVLANLFAAAGYEILSASASTNRYVRLLDIIQTLIRDRRFIDIQCLEVYGGPSFVVEDISSRMGKLLGHRLVMVLHGGAMPEFMARFPRWTRRVLSRADALVAPSAYLAHAVERYGFQAQVIPNVVDLTAYPYRHRRRLRPRFFWMRTFHPTYNPEMAVRVLAKVSRTIPDTTFVMAGQDKGTQAAMQQLAKTLMLADAVHFPGFLDMASKVREGNAADIFLNTNHVDNMPIAVVEACAMGLPVVATAVGGIPDLLTDGETGLLVCDNDDDAMVEAIFRLLGNADLAGRLSANGRQLAEQSSWEQVRPQWEQVFAEVMGRQNHGEMGNL